MALGASISVLYPWYLHPGGPRILAGGENVTFDTSTFNNPALDADPSRPAQARQEFTNIVGSKSTVYLLPTKLKASCLVHVRSIIIFSPSTPDKVFHCKDL